MNMDSENLVEENEDFPLATERVSSYQQNLLQPYSKAMVSLLRAIVVEHNSTVWEDILRYQYEIQKNLGALGLEVIIKKEEGYAYLKEFEADDGHRLGLASIYPLGHLPSMVLVLLRQIYDEQESDFDNLSQHKYVLQTELKEQLDAFLIADNNQAKTEKKLVDAIKKVEELGFLVQETETDKETKYRIHPLIKEKITLDVLNDYKNRMQEYVKSV